MLMLEKLLSAKLWLIAAVGLEKPSHAEAETTVEGRDGLQSGALVLNSPVQENCSVEPKAGSESEVTGGMAGPGNGKRKIVKKTVRVVKKIIKKRVPKRVLTESPEDQGSVKKVENGLNLREVTEKSNQIYVVMENSNLVNDMKKNELIDKYNLANEEKEKSKPANEITEKLNIETGSCVMVPMKVGTGNDLGDINSRDIEQLKINDVIIAELNRRDSNVIISDLMEVKKIGSAAKVTEESETTKGVEGIVAEDLSKDLVLKNQDVGTVENENVWVG
ncbi:uncharacterized protein Fot_37023 [Forsythia ovata]|uniref:Uncharacterized protein n=1 Tax=Forsythia ovata TaxID=205694 RepID=A0ABD1SR87_9LAMI